MERKNIGIACAQETHTDRIDVISIRNYTICSRRNGTSGEETPETLTNLDLIKEGSAIIINNELRTRVSGIYIKSTG